MIPVNTAQTTFVGGELSPSLLGRSDLARFSTSASTLENFMPSMEGQLSRRVGTKVITHNGTITHSDGRLLAFSSGSFSAPILFRNLQAMIFGSTVPEQVSVTTPYTLAQVDGIQVCQVNDVLFLTHPSHPPARLARYGVGSWAYEVLPLESGPYLDYADADAGTSLKISAVVDRITLTSTATDFAGRAVNDYVEYNSTSSRTLGKIVTFTSSSVVVIEPLQERCFTPSSEVYGLGIYTGYGAGGTAPYNLANAANYTVLPTGTATLTNRKVGFTAQNVITNNIVDNFLRFADISGAYRWMAVTTREDIPQQSSFGIVAIGDILAVNGQIVPVPYTGTVTQSARSITATMTASSDTFTSSDVGRWFRLEYGAYIVDAQVSTVTNARSAAVYLTRGVPLSGQSNSLRMDSTTTVWRRGAFFPGNYPKCVSFFEQRLCFANTLREPQTVWLSTIADYYNFAPSDADAKVQDDSSINLTMATDVFQDIRWLTNRSVLVAGTSNAEWVITAGQNRDALTSKTVTARRESSYGTADVQGIQSGRSTLFIQNGGLRLRELTYDYSVDANVPVDITVFAQHILTDQGGATEIHYARQPDPMILLVTASGQVAVMVYEPDQKVYAWARYIHGGTGSPKVMSLCVTQGQGEDTIWALVLRGSLYTVEQFFPAYRPSSNADVSTLYYFLDSAASFATGSASVTLTGHERFRDTSVAVLIDDQLYSEITTVGLLLTLPKVPATRLWVGFVSTAKVVSYPVSFESKTGATQGRTRLITGIILRARNTLDFHYGVNGVTLEEHKVRTTDDPVTRTPYLRSGDIKLSFPRKFDTLVQWTIESRRPYPITIQSVSLDITQTN